MEVVPWQNVRRVYMDTISSLMKSVFTLNIVEYLPHTYAVTCCNYSSFVKLILVFAQRLLRAYIKWIKSFIKSLVGVTASCANIGYLGKFSPN